MTTSEVAQGFTSAADDDRRVDPRLARLAAAAAARARGALERYANGGTSQGH